MDNQGKTNNAIEMEVQVIYPDIHTEIVLDGSELLKFDAGQPGTAVACTAGMLWLTQPGDLHDHFLRAGQSFTLYQTGTVLVQGLPSGKARIELPAA
jgi:hypothetical protein